jgi:ATP-dependent DNA helicase RecG
VPAATLIWVKDAHRFGLAQLHQLRGRVGRGKEASYAILETPNRSESTKKRLNVLTTTNDGFLIAKEDLKLRGGGDIFGLAQSGIGEGFFSDLTLYSDLFDRVQTLIQKLLVSTMPEDKNFVANIEKLNKQQSIIVLN